MSGAAGLAAAANNRCAQRSATSPSPPRDCETWMFPGMLLTQPDIAAMMLEYRVARIPGAEYKAQT